MGFCLHAAERYALRFALIGTRKKRLAELWPGRGMHDARWLIGKTWNETVIPPLLEIRDLTFSVSDQKILDRLDFTIRPGEIHALLGANGSGKTTLAYLKGADLFSLKMHERAKLGLTLAWQEPARFEGITVREYLTLGRSESNPKPVLVQVGLDPERYLNRRVDKALSGGERHRIELASVLAMKPTLAILDEPAAGIDMLSINHIINVIRMLKENGGAVLLITHQEEVAAIADSASQLCNGRIIFSGDPVHVIEHFRGRTCVRCDGEVCGYVRA
jgi:Fe-S cluster assembly ATP-binding protein